MDGLVYCYRCVFKNSEDLSGHFCIKAFLNGAVGGTIIRPEALTHNLHTAVNKLPKCMYIYARNLNHKYEKAAFDANHPVEMIYFFLWYCFYGD